MKKIPTTIEQPLRIAQLNRNVFTNKSHKIGLPSSEGLFIKRIEDIVSVEAKGNYTYFKFKEGKALLVSKTLQEVQSILQHNTLFVRTHRSFIVNIDTIIQYKKGKKAYLILENEQIIVVSEAKKAKLNAKLAEWLA